MQHQRRPSRHLGSRRHQRRHRLQVRRRPARGHERLSLRLARLDLRLVHRGRHHGRLPDRSARILSGDQFGELNQPAPIGTVTNFTPVEGAIGQHFGLVTWTPPATKNVRFLIHVWATLDSGIQSADRTETKISNNGNGRSWDDWEVVDILVTPTRRPTH
jgi:hypothetical protein